MGSEKAVIIKGGDNSLREEFKAGGIITPGQLLYINSAGAVLRHNAAVGVQSALFANIDFPQGNDIDDNYASGEQVQCIHALPGDVINCLLKDGETVVVGSKVESAGDGDMQLYVADSAAQPAIPNSIVGTAIEALDMSDSSAADPASRRFKVQVG